MPPPARTEATPSSTTSVRMAMLLTQRAVEAEMQDRAAIDAARLRLQLVDDLHRADLRGAGDRAAGKAGGDQMQRVEAGLQPSAHHRNEMVHRGVGLQPAENRHLDTVPGRQTREKSLRIRSTIMMFSARSFSLSSSFSPRRRSSAGSAERALRALDRARLDLAVAHRTGNLPARWRRRGGRARRSRRRRAPDWRCAARRKGRADRSRPEAWRAEPASSWPERCRRRRCSACVRSTTAS